MKMLKNSETPFYLLNIPEMSYKSEITFQMLTYNHCKHNQIQIIRNKFVKYKIIIKKNPESAEKYKKS